MIPQNKERSRIVKVTIKNRSCGDISITAEADPIISSTLDVSGIEVCSELVVSASAVTNVIGGELEQHYMLQPGDHVTVTKRIGRDEYWKGA